MFDLPFQIFTLIANVSIIVFVGYYLFKLNAKEKVFEKKEQTVDEQYHHVVDEALAKERKILEDAASQAGEIISQAKSINTSSQEQINHALEKIIADSHTQALSLSQQSMNQYAAYLKQIANSSLANFSTLSKELEDTMKQNTKTIQESMLPSLQKELEAYRQMRLKETDQIVQRIVQKASQEILNRSISLEDHQNLVIQSLEKAKKEGVFDS